MSAPKPPRCGNCALWTGPRGKHGRALQTYAKCAAPIPERPLLSTAYDYITWPPRQGSVLWPDDGEGCRTHQPIQAKEEPAP